MKLGVGPAVATVVRAVDDVSGASFLDRHAQGDGLENVHAFFTPTTLQWMLKTLIAGIARIVTAVARASGRGAARGMWDVACSCVCVCVEAARAALGGRRRKSSVPAHVVQAPLNPLP